MEKRNQKVSINLTKEQYTLLERLAQFERRSVSELAALIVIDTTIDLYARCQPQGEMTKASYSYYLSK